MGTHSPHDEDDGMPRVGDPGNAWEWVGKDGLTDTQRALQELDIADMLPKFKLEEPPEA